jgi:mono/diheme cytochrome c family protein
MSWREEIVVTSTCRVARAVAGTVLLAALASCAVSPEPTNPGTAIDPAALYQRYCSACHGENGDGNSLAQSALATKPRDFTAEESRLRLSREYMIAIVRDGRPHTPMTARSTRLSQQEIEAVVDYIRRRFMPAERRDSPAKRN